MNTSAKPKSSDVSGSSPSWSTPTTGQPSPGSPSRRPSASPTDGGEIRERTEWHRAVAWGDLAEEIASRFKKGDSRRRSTGAMRINSYEKDGAKNRITELHVDKAEPNLDNAALEERSAPGRRRARGREGKASTAAPP